MKLRVTLEREGDQPVDLAITADSSATVADLAEHLYLGDPTRRGARTAPERLTIGVVGAQHRAIEPSSLLSSSAIHSGQRITLTQGGLRYRDAQTRDVAAYLAVHEGPDAGQEFPLSSGSNVVGRAKSCQLQLTDPMVSREHVRINVTDTPEVIDMGSANGVLVNDRPVERENLQPLDRVTIGDTVFSIRMVHRPATEGRVESTAVAFIRSPRLVKAFEGKRFKAPEIPAPPQRQRFPILVLIAPILLGGVMYWVTQQTLTLLFMALSPLMMLGHYFEQMIQGKGAYKRAMKQYREDVELLVKEVEAANAEEVASRLVEHPSVGECLDSVRGLTNLLWTRRLDSPGFAEFRLGLGSQPARSVVELPDPSRAPRAIFADLAEKVAVLASVDPVPIVATPARDGGLGIAGARGAAVAVARALVVQAAALHSPEDLVLAAIGSATTGRDWEWMKWLPHCHSSSSPLALHLAGNAGDAANLLGPLEELVLSRAEQDDHGDFTRPAVLLVVESDAPAEFGRLVELAERGWRHGVYVLWIAPDLGQLPAACRVFLDVRSFTEGTAGYLHSGDQATPVLLEPTSPEDTSQVARALSPITDLAARSDDASDVPRSVNMLSLSGYDPAITPASIIERWQANRSIVSGPLAPARLAKRQGNLRAVIGQSALGPHSLDLRADGPHALVGGTTGSGKSELLQTWILSMAANHSPQRLTFLLVDYKGGSAFADCNNLPHTVGLVTDLAKNGVRRALTSLAAELHHRERLITQRHRCKDLPMMEKKHPAEAPPSLVIVVDEFAALVHEVPEFIEGVVNVAQRGRSLGLHMILATQQPSGVIKGALRANTNLRLALRVSDVDDSNDILGSPQAAHFDQATPGRAVSKTGPSRLVPFQTGYVGGHSDQVAPKAAVAVQELVFGAGLPWEKPEVDQDVAAERGPADITRIVGAVIAAHESSALPAPRKPWLPDLAKHYDLASKELESRRTDTELVYGMLDDPDRQRQEPVAFRPDVEGNLIAYGASGSGKTTLLRTLAVAAGLAVQQGPCHVYGLDFASGGLGMLEGLPHVGSIVSGSDDERVQRLFRFLRDEMSDRVNRYKAVNASTIAEYRVAARRPGEPRLLVLLDGVPAFRAAYEGSGKWAYMDLFIDLASRGRAVGLHFLMTSDQRSGLTAAMASSVQSRVVLRMADPEDYGALGVPGSILTAGSAPGRAVVEGREVQVAVLGRSGDAHAQATALEQLSAALQRLGVRPAAPIRRLPEHVSVTEIPATPGRLRVGMESEGFGPALVEPRGPFVVTGPVGSGRTTTLLTLIEELKREGFRTTVLADRRTVVTAAVPRGDAFVGSDAICAALPDLGARLEAEASAREAFIIEGLGELGGSDAEYMLPDFIRMVITHDSFIVAEGEVTSLSQAYETMKRFKAAKTAIYLQPDDSLSSVIGAELPLSSPSKFVPGRGYLVTRGKVALVQATEPAGGEN